jgi:tetratricopeptide (TPR) repeat protein
MIRNELPYENYIEMATWYVKLGLDDEAVQLLKLAPEYPSVYYWLGYLLKDKKPTESKKYLDKARELSVRLAFPFREESIPVFQWAIESSAEDWKAKYYLGLIYWSRGRLEEVRKLFALCGEPDYAVFYITRGYLNEETDSKRSLADFEKAVEIDGEDWRNWHHLIGFYSRQDMIDKALVSAQEAAEKFPNESKIKIDLALAMAANGRYAEALVVLEETQVLPYEGASEVHTLYVGCHIHLAVESMEEGNYVIALEHIGDSKAYPEHLGTGQPFESDFSLQERLAEICQDRIGAGHKKDSRVEIPPEVLELIEALDNKYD